MRHYRRGVVEARGLEARWELQASRVDPERHAAVARKLAIQAREGSSWSAKCLTYFQGKIGRPLPDEPAPGQ